jgi:multidrug efflux pump subunit AcrA (membrane-fusion protein)
MTICRVRVRDHLVALAAMLFGLAGHRCQVARAKFADAGMRQPASNMSEQRTTAGTTLVLPGYLRAWQEAAIYARVKGYLKQWHVDFGASAKAGQILAEIDTPDLNDSLEVAETKLAAAKAMVETRQTELDFAKSTYERWHRAPIGVVSVQGTLTKQDDFEIAAARLHTAIAEMNVVQGEVGRLRQQLKFKRIASPLDGVLIERNLNIGMPVNDSCGTMERPDRALLRVIDLHKILLQLSHSHIATH